MNKTMKREMAKKFFSLMNERRTIREFSEEDIDIELIYECIKTAGTAPSGANMQPWQFVVIRDKALKKKIRIAAEKEEYDFYHHRNNSKWLEDLKPLKTNWKKKHLEDAPVLIAIFSKNFNDIGKSEKCYYAKESVGIATGILITALHRLGLATLTHTPSPMNFLNEILCRPKNEKPFLILVVGHEKENSTLPNIRRKNLKDFCISY